MDRRAFIQKTIALIASGFFADLLAFMPMVQAKGKTIVCPNIKETYLKFVLPLENRLQTDFIVLHHIGESNEDFSAAEIHRWHINNGWAGIGYHFVIRKNGTIERGRPIDTIGAHCYGYNKRSVGINVVGDFEKDFPTNDQLRSAVQLTAYLCQLYRLNPFGDEVILGHCDLNNTLCPGKNFYSELHDFRTKTQKVFKT